MNKVEIAKLLIKHPAIRELTESVSKEQMLSVMAEELLDLDEAAGQDARSKVGQVLNQLKAAIKNNKVKEFLKKYYPDEEFSFGSLNVGGQPIETYLANNPEGLSHLKKGIARWVALALMTQKMDSPPKVFDQDWLETFEAPKDFGQDWIETPAQLPAVSLTPPEQPEEEPEGDLGPSIDADVREQFEMRLKNTVSEEAVVPFLIFFTNLRQQHITEETSMITILQGANMLVGKNPGQIRRALQMMATDDRKAVLAEFRKIDKPGQVELVDLMKELLPQGKTPEEEPAEVEVEVVPEEEPEVEPEAEIIPITAEDLEGVSEAITAFFSQEKDVGFMKQMFLSKQSEVLMGFMNALRSLLSGYGRAKAITEQEGEELEMSLSERRAIVRDMKNIKVTMGDLVDLIKRYDKFKTRVSPDARFDGTKLKRKIQEELEDTQLAIAKLYKRIVQVILSGEDVVNEEVEVSAEDKAENVRRVYGELLTVYNDTFGPIISKNADFSEEAVRDAAKTSMDIIVDSGIVDYFPSQRFSPKVDPNTTLADAMGHLTESLKELASYISIVFAKVNTNDVTADQARTFLKRLRGIAQVLELDFGAESMINALPEVEEENPEVALITEPGDAREFGPGLSQPWPSNLEEKLIPIIKLIAEEQ